MNKKNLLKENNVFFSISDFFTKNNKLLDKEKVINNWQKNFNLVKDSKVFYNKDFAIRFSFSKNNSFSGTVLSLSKLQKYDNKPFFVLLITPPESKIFIANSSFINKISHSSKNLSLQNIKGSFNGTNIMKEISNYENNYNNFSKLYYEIHNNTTFDENLERIVEATNGIQARKEKFVLNSNVKSKIYKSIIVNENFVKTHFFNKLEKKFIQKIKENYNLILCAGHIENSKKRGEIIEYILTTEQNELTEKLQQDINDNNYYSINTIKTKNLIYDYFEKMSIYNTGTDIKVKILNFSSAPKGVNIDKLLEFLSSENSVFLILLVGIDREKNNIKCKLINFFDKRIILSNRIQHHWAGKNSRGVTQFDGEELQKILDSNTETKIDIQIAKKFINETFNL